MAEKRKHCTINFERVSPVSVDAQNRKKTTARWSFFFHSS